MDARSKLVKDQWELIEDSPFNALAKLYLANGNEEIVWQNGSRHGLVANTEKSGHGFTLDLGFVDEAFAQVDDRLEQAFSPAMITRPQPQQWVVSTAGTDASVFLARKVLQGRTNVNKPGSRTAFFEWSADPDADPFDPATWWSCMPALGHTVTEAAVAAELEKMELPEFKRAYLNIPTRADEGETVLSQEAWVSGRLEDPTGHDLPSPVTFAVDVGIDLASASIAAAGDLGNDRAHVEVVDSRPGAAWVVDRVGELLGRHGGQVLIGSRSPASALLPDFERAGVDVVQVAAGDVAQACGLLPDLVVNGRLVHAAHPGLDLAAQVARRKTVGDEWVWIRRDDSHDITPLYAATLAIWGALKAPPPSDPGIYVI
jgi:hypothetical protein